MVYQSNVVFLFFFLPVEHYHHSDLLFFSVIGSNYFFFLFFIHRVSQDSVMNPKTNSGTFPRKFIFISGAGTLWVSLSQQIG